MKSMIRHGALVLPALLLTTLASTSATAQSTTAVEPAAFELTVANIMRGEDLVGRSPDDIRWSVDSRELFFRWRQPESTDTTTHLYRVAADGGEPRMVPDSLVEHAVPARGGRWSSDRSHRAEIRGGDVYVVSRRGDIRRMTATPTRERSPHLSPDASTVYFMSGSNVFAMDMDGGPLRQLTDIRTSDEPEERESEGQRAFLEAQQEELFAVIRDELAEEAHEEAVDSMRREVKPLYIGEDGSLNSAEVSPSGRYVLLAISEDADTKRTIVPDYVTATGYTEDLNARSKVGDAREGQRSAILDLETGDFTWIEVEPADQERSLIPMGWGPNSDRALVMGLTANNEDRRLYVVDSSGAVTLIDHLHDDAWVGGPGLYTMGWLPDGDRIYFVSERSGFAHLYTVPATGGEATALTAGDWEVTDVQLSLNGETFYLTTSEIHPGERQLYTLSAEGGERVRITSMDGWNESLVSPDGESVAVLHSRGNQPPELFLRETDRGSDPEQITLSTTAEFRAGPWIRPEIIEFTARDGVEVPARIFRPEDLGAEPNGAAVLFVHGAGYLQNVHHGWSSYYREYMFHHLLASRGYTVLDVDYRGSSGYGRDWRTAIYRYMGGKDLTDFVDAAGYLVENESIDPDRIGLYGGSYGGFITLMAMFTEPDVFAAGAALRSVTDWAHYNHGYTSNILNEPQDDGEAYRRSSPIYFAEGLEGHLLIAHGMVDTNVHFQDVVRLVQRLIELGKTDWELAVYPAEGHGFVRPESWTDEYRRILELFETTIGSTAQR
ncbi:MAG TPA: prolyl oligopeptidase family serine peptidase [Longimicrobiaceae bacterium]|nr:prolyl oligopeptidase family serine peptidase [Longimicrobiaceae bacterium]